MNANPAEIAATTQVDASAIRAEGAAAAQARITAILTCEEAKGREPQAQNLALKTSLSVDEAKSLLATLPVAVVATLTATGPTIAERSAAPLSFDLGGTETRPDPKASWRSSLARVGATLPSSH